MTLPVWKGSALAALLVSALAAESLTHVEDADLMPPLPMMKMPRWINGGFVTVQFRDPKPPLIWTFGRDSPRSFPFSVPGVQSTLVYDCDQGPDGTIGISGSATDFEGRVATFVAFVSPSGNIAQMIRTGLYRPAMVAVASDGAIWTVGSEISELSRRGQLVPHAAALRRYDRSGKLVGSFVPQSTIQDAGLNLGRTRNTLRASKDRIAWYSVDGRYVELSIAGTVLTDITAEIPAADGLDAPEKGRVSFALTDDGDAFLSVPYQKSSVEVLRTYVLDKFARAWKPVPLVGPPPRSGSGYIFGADGRRLVVQSGKLVRFYAIGN